MTWTTEVYTHGLQVTSADLPFLLSLRKQLSQTVSPPLKKPHYLLFTQMRQTLLSNCLKYEILIHQVLLHQSDSQMYKYQMHQRCPV